ncbi:MAG: sigma-70 family RNA polymerase sigma factor [Planctomycetaceae bacterium]|nr:sigma-70 family RNA polymerase sigma factor [Planctomycetaceae bacterium]
MSDATQLLYRIDAGDSSAADELLPLVYDELRRLATAQMAAESPEHTLQPTALVHEAYLRLVDDSGASQWNGRGHFFGAAAEAMRRILINRARDKGRLKRSGDRHRIHLEHIELATDVPDDRLMDIDECLTKFAAEHPECAQLVKLRFFTGLTLREAAAANGVSLSTAKRRWTFARAWLYDALQMSTEATDS